MIPVECRVSATTLVFAESSFMASPASPLPGSTVSRLTMNVCPPTENEPSTSRPSAAPTNQGEVNSSVDWTFSKPNRLAIVLPRAGSKTRATTGAPVRSPQCAPKRSRTAMAVSMFTMSLLVITATADESATRAASRVGRRVASPKITGTPSSCASDRNRLPWSGSITTTCLPASTSAATRIPNEPRPITTTCPDIPRTRRRPMEWFNRRLINMSDRKAISMAMVVIPAIIRKIAHIRSRGDWSMKLKSP
jgi:hypothetical protein